MVVEQRRNTRSESREGVHASHRTLLLLLLTLRARKHPPRIRFCLVCVEEGAGRLSVLVLSYKRQTGKEATRFFHSAGLRDSSRLIVIMCGAQTGNQFRSAKQGKNGSSGPCVLSLYFGSLDFVVVVVRLLFLCFFSMSFVRRLCVCVLCV